MFEKFLRVLGEVLEEIVSRDATIAIYVHGSYARRDLHQASDIDVVALVQGEGIYCWERRDIEGVIISTNLRSLDVMDRMVESDPWTIVGLKDAEIFYDPRGLLAGYRDRALLSEELWQELVVDSLDDARINFGRAEKAFSGGDLVSAMLEL